MMDPGSARLRRLSGMTMRKTETKNANGSRFSWTPAPALPISRAILFIVDDLDGRPRRPVCA
jgi:hypothetical protein